MSDTCLKIMMLKREKTGGQENRIGADSYTIFLQDTQYVNSKISRNDVSINRMGKQFGLSSVKISTSYIMCTER